MIMLFLNLLNIGIYKFIYAASMGTMRWFYSKQDEEKNQKIY